VHAAPAAPGPESEPPEDIPDGHRALREQTHQAQHHSEELLRRAAELSARATELRDDSRRIAADRPATRLMISPSRPHATTATS
jgi:hypothetical protein